jgi:levansucrase
VIYDRARETTGTVGTIKAFRDPTWFRDPADGNEYLLFTASLAASSSAFNGSIGVACRSGHGWELRPPLITADGVNNELERPHIVVADSRYYLFWSTQASVFAPGITAPTGLYGMVAPRLQGPWTPINGTGLVIGNPPAAPDQAYSWLVLADLRVTSFIDRCPGFVGRPAPELRLMLSGDSAALVPIASGHDAGQNPVATVRFDDEQG